MGEVGHVGHSPVASTSTSTKINNALLELMHIMCRGIERIFNSSGNKVPVLSSRPALVGGEDAQVPGYHLKALKNKGVEPGYVAVEKWGAKHDKEMLHGNAHGEKNLNAAAKSWLKEQISRTGEKENPDLENCMKNAASSMCLQPPYNQPTEIQEIAYSQLSEPDKAFDSLGEELQDKLLNEMLQAIVETKDQLVDVNEALRGKLTQRLESTENRFKAEQFMKLNYGKGNKTIFGKYTIPYSNAKAIGNIPIIGKLLHQLGKLSSPQSINRGAVMEKMGNDLMQALKISTQDLKIVRTSYEYNTPQLILVSEKIENFNDFDGKDKAINGAIYIKDGVFVRNTESKVFPGIFDGPPVLCRDVGNVAASKVKMALMGDRDALGSAGANKGYTKNKSGKTEFIGIDPGHAFSKNLMSKKGDVKSDLSMDRASALKSRDYKNFTAFDQATFAEKMEGVRELKRLAEKHPTDQEDLEVFRKMAKEFDTGETDFSAEIEETKNLYISRRADILNTFASRLAVDEFSFGEEIDASTEKKMESRDQTLNLLDGLEKLTSKTVGTANGVENGIRLHIPQIKKTEDRKAWDVQQSANKNTIFFTFTGKPREVEKTMKILEKFRASNEDGASVLTSDGRQITLSIPSEKIKQVQAAFDYERIMYHKHR